MKPYSIKEYSNLYKKRNQLRRLCILDWMGNEKVVCVFFNSDFKNCPIVGPKCYGMTEEILYDFIKIELKKSWPHIKILTKYDEYHVSNICYASRRLHDKLNEGEMYISPYLKSITNNEDDEITKNELKEYDDVIKDLHPCETLDEILDAVNNAIQTIGSGNYLSKKQIKKKFANDLLDYIKTQSNECVLKTDNPYFEDLWEIIHKLYSSNQWFDGYTDSYFMDSLIKIAEVTQGFKYDTNSLQLTYSKSLNLWVNNDDGYLSYFTNENDDLSWTDSMDDKNNLIESYTPDMYAFRKKYDIFPFGNNLLNNGDGEMSKTFDNLPIILK